MSTLSLVIDVIRIRKYHPNGLPVLLIRLAHSRCRPPLRRCSSSKRAIAGGAITAQAHNRAEVQKATAVGKRGIKHSSASCKHHVSTISRFDSLVDLAGVRNLRQQRQWQDAARDTARSPQLPACSQSPPLPLGGYGRRQARARSRLRAAAGRRRCY